MKVLGTSKRVPGGSLSEHSVMSIEPDVDCMHVNFGLGLKILIPELFLACYMISMQAVQIGQVHLPGLDRARRNDF